MLRKHFWLLFLCLALMRAWVRPTLLSGAGFEGQKKTPVRVPSFRDEVRPLLQAKCFRCHGEKGRKADLDLRTPAGILEGGESGQVIVPGKPEKSLLYEKVPVTYDARSAGMTKTIFPFGQTYKEIAEHGA